MLLYVLINSPLAFSHLSIWRVFVFCLHNLQGYMHLETYSKAERQIENAAEMNDHMNVEFPVLKPGANAISWTGTVTRVVVRPNWRFL